MTDRYYSNGSVHASPTGLPPNDGVEFEEQSFIINNGTYSDEEDRLLDRAMAIFNQVAYMLKEW